MGNAFTNLSSAKLFGQDGIIPGVPACASCGAPAVESAQVGDGLMPFIRRPSRKVTTQVEADLGLLGFDSPMANGSEPALMMPVLRPHGGTGHRRDSQAAYASRSQSVLIFDWDDTLFPTNYVRKVKGLKWNVALMNQGRPQSELLCIQAALKATEMEAIALLQQAIVMCHVMIVTLARSPWVKISCENFYPGMGDFLKSVDIQIIYAQEDLQGGTPPDGPPEAVEQFWADVKGRAIERAVHEFYSQYEGQTWKNIISIGDSDFERLGTIATVEKYLTAKGLEISPQAQEVDGHVIKVRAKTFKMLDEPTAAELRKQNSLLQRWLPAMVTIDKGFDLILDDLTQEHILRIENALKDEK